MEERYGHTLAWGLMVMALALHVIDEAVNDFLSVYNPAVEAVRRALPLLPLPTFTFRQWIVGLALALVALTALTPMIRRAHRWTLRLSWWFALLMTLNALGHLAGTLYLARPMPGVMTSPLLLVASWFLWRQANRRRAAGRAIPGDRR